MNKWTKVGAWVLGLGLVLTGTLGISSKKEKLQDREIVTAPATSSCSLPEVKASKLILKQIDLDPARTVYINGEIVDEGMEGITKKVIVLGRDTAPIYVVLNSPGGSVSAGEKFISAMQSARGPVYTICDGLCASMAAIITEYGTKRYATNRSILMFHDAAGGFQGYVSHMKSQLQLIDRKVEKMDNFICLRIKIPCGQYKQGKLAQIWVDAEDGFVDEVITSLENPVVTESNSNEQPAPGFQFKLTPNEPFNLKGFTL